MLAQNNYNNNNNFYHNNNNGNNNDDDDNDDNNGNELTNRNWPEIELMLSWFSGAHLLASLSLVISAVEANFH